MISYIKYSLCDIISDVITFCICSCDTGIMNIMFESQKKNTQNMEITPTFLHKFPSKRSFRHRIHSLLRRGARESTVIYRI